MTQKTEVQKRADEARAYLKANTKDFKEDALKGKTDEEIVALGDACRAEVKKREDAAAEAAKPITRGEVETMLAANNETLKNELLPQVGTAVRDSLKEIFAPAATQRSESEGEDKKTKPNEGAELGKAIGEAMRSAMEPIVAQVKEQGEALKAVTESVEKIAGQTSVRSDEGDGKQATVKKDPFVGIFRRGAVEKKQEAAQS